MLKFAIVRILYKLKILKWFSPTIRRSLYNTSYRIPLKGNVGYKNLFEWDSWMLPILKRLNIEEGVFIDVGANIGQTLLKYKSLLSSQNYIGLEPNPHCVKYLQELIKINNFSSIKIIPKALTNQKDQNELILYQNDITDGMASLIPQMRPNNKESKRIKVDTITGADFAKEVEGKVQCIKIDVEGSELEVLKNLNFIITRDRPYIIIEILPVYEISNTLRYNNQIAIEGILSENDYEIYLIKNIQSKFNSLIHKTNFGIHSDINQVDYLLIPKEKVKRIL